MLSTRVTPLGSPGLEVQRVSDRELAKLATVVVWAAARAWEQDPPEVMWASEEEASTALIVDSGESAPVVAQRGQEVYPERDVASGWEMVGLRAEEVGPEVGDLAARAAFGHRGSEQGYEHSPEPKA